MILCCPLYCTVMYMFMKYIYHLHFNVFLDKFHLLLSAKRPMLYSNLISACESGWDFSSRWFSRNDGENLTLNTISTMDIIPVDLNSILCRNEQIFKMFYLKIGKLYNKKKPKNLAITKLISRTCAFTSTSFLTNVSIIK
jgi:hypothetical protein